MAVQTKSDIKDQVCEWIDEQMGMGDSLHDAAVVAVEKVIKEGLSTELIREFGLRALTSLWRDRNQKQRRVVQGERRIDTAALSTDVFDALYKVGDEWICLGDMDKLGCQEAAAYYQEATISEYRKSLMFKRIGEALSDDEIVRQKLDVEEIAAIIEDSNSQAASYLA